MDDTPENPVRIRVRNEGCVGHQRCAGVAPQVYRLNAEGFNEMAEVVVDGGLAAPARRGARACPEGIITIEAVDAGEPTSD